MEIFAGFLRRVAAYVVDSLVLLIPAVLIDYAMGSREGLASLLQLAMWWIYKAGMESGAGQATLGKKALGIKVTGLDGERISFARASGRYFGMFLSALILSIGFLMAAFTAKRQALHDMLASCLVVRADATPEEIREGHGTMPMSLGTWIAAVIVLFVPILGILAAIAIPAYQDYTQRAKIAEALADGVRWKQEAASEFASYARQPASATAEPVREVEHSSRFVSRIVMRKSERTLEIALDRGAFPASAGLAKGDAAIELKMNADGTTWACSGRGVPDKWLPPSCRL